MLAKAEDHTEIWLEKYCIARKVLGSPDQLILYTYSMLPEHVVVTTTCQSLCSKLLYCKNNIMCLNPNPRVFQ